MRILAIDPGPTASAYVDFLDNGLVVRQLGHLEPFGKLPNDPMLEIVRHWRGDVVVIEWITVASVAGAEIYQTCRWVGRFEEAAGVPVVLLPRGEVLQHFFGKRNVKSADSLIRRTMLDRFGGDGAKGTKASPGPLYGFSADCWSALAVAIAYADQEVRA